MKKLYFYIYTLLSILAILSLILLPFGILNEYNIIVDIMQYILVIAAIYYMYVVIQNKFWFESIDQKKFYADIFTLVLAIYIINFNQ